MSGSVPGAGSAVGVAGSAEGVGPIVPSEVSSSPADSLAGGERRHGNHGDKGDKGDKFEFFSILFASLIKKLYSLL